MVSATDWQSGDPLLGEVQPMPSKPRGMPSNDPHAGMMVEQGDDDEADPHAGMMMGGAGEADPHAGVPGAPPLSGGAGGAASGIDVTQLGMQSPDPNRPIDPNRRIRGTLKISAAVAAKAQPGAVLYLMVRKLSPDGKQGTLIAVDKLKWTADGQSFELTERNAMVQGGPDLIGELMLMARIDGDEDAMTRESGDIIGQTKVNVPSDGVVLTLDSMIP
jgi:hypothetical protein